MKPTAIFRHSLLVLGVWGLLVSCALLPLTEQPIATATNTPIPSATNTVTPKPTTTPSPTLTPSQTPTRTPRPTRTPNLAATATQSAYQALLTEARQWSLLVEDTFERDKGLWTLGTDRTAYGESKREVLEDVLRWTVTARKEVNDRIYIKQTLPADFLVDVDFEFVTQYQDNYAGIYVGNADEFYVFELSSGGDLGVYRLIKDRWTTSLKPFRVAAFDARATQHLSIVRVGTQWQFFYNDVWVGELTNTKLTEVNVGVVVETATLKEPVTVEFDNFRVRSAKKVAATPAAAAAPNTCSSGLPADKWELIVIRSSTNASAVTINGTAYALTEGGITIIPLPAKQALTVELPNGFTQQFNEPPCGSQIIALP